MPASFFDEDMLEHIKTLTVLCVDDSSTAIMLYETLLKDIVKELIIAHDGNEGFDKFLTNNVDVVFTDYEMPNLNGLEMIKRIRSFNMDVPIILVSAIRNTDVVVEAINNNTTGFIQKPFQKETILSSISKSAKILIANKFLEDERELKLKSYEEKEKYSIYQEDLAFAKELNILRNDFYYQMIDMNDYAFIDFFYQPLDTLSGDAYSARLIDEHINFYIIVDGMGKGLSASLSSMLMTSFINHLIDISKEFDLHEIIRKSIEYIKPILLDDETLSINYIVHENNIGLMSYATFAMPALLLEDTNGEIIRVKSNNPPISKYIKNYNINSIDIKNITKFLYYSDGIIENRTRFNNKLYNDFIEKDFIDSYSREDMKEKVLWKIDKAEDDMTFIFINKPNLKANLIEEKSFKPTLAEVDNAFDWYSSLWHSISESSTERQGASVAFTELYMNAYEHGSLGIDSVEKNKLLENDTYYDKLLELEQCCTKNRLITVSVHKIKHHENTFIITKITDMGEGFNTTILSDMFRHSRSYNGRGVFISRQSSHGIYYNSKGNSVIYLNKI